MKFYATTLLISLRYWINQALAVVAVSYAIIGFMASLAYGDNQPFDPDLNTLKTAFHLSMTTWLLAQGFRFVFGRDTSARNGS
jgi:hypothetical protein